MYSSVSVLGIIPARYDSSRFHKKVLYPIAGKSMVQRVYEQAIQVKNLAELVVATDHEQVFEHVQSFGGKAIMTSPDHASGTDRCFEAFTKVGDYYDYVVNIQADEPFIQPAQIQLLVDLFQDSKAIELATLIKKIDDVSILTDPNEVRVVFNTHHEALYFTRAIIPYVPSVPAGEWLTHFDYYKHVGLYAYRSDILEKITKIPPSPLEKTERLEQLRWLEHGYKIKVAITELDSYCIDVPEDLEHPYIQKFLQ